MPACPIFCRRPLLTGTFGAFIRIRSPIYTERMLFDVGGRRAAGGFRFSAAGAGHRTGVFQGDSRHRASKGRFTSARPRCCWLLEKAIFPGVSGERTSICIRWPARPGSACWPRRWNLLPIGQLDGGHIVYSLPGDRHKMVSPGSAWALLARARSLVLAGLAVVGRRAALSSAGAIPLIFDPRSAGRGRKQLAWLALVIFLLCFTPAPCRTECRILTGA